MDKGIMEETDGAFEVSNATRPQPISEQQVVRRPTPSPEDTIPEMDVATRRVWRPHEFRTLLQKERARTERSDLGFALVLFDCRRSNGNRIREKIEAELKRRIRLTDEIGWFDESRLGVLLPYTDFAGGEAFARLASPDLGLNGSTPEWSIYTYPDYDDTTPAESGSESGTIRETPELSTPFAVPTSATPANVPHRAERRRDREMRVSKIFVQPLPRWKRILDVAGASLALLALTPVFLATALAIKLTTRGPVFFQQHRAGRGGRPFGLYKFRSMYVGAEQMKLSLLQHNEQTGPVFKMKRDPRVFPVGGIIRKLSIDELPQLWNVLVGDMSLVGPRPPTLDEICRYDIWQLRRLELTPGITCIWQVSGRSEIGFMDWVRMDIRYSRQVRLGTDLALLVKTIPAVLSTRGAH